MTAKLATPFSKLFQGMIQRAPRVAAPPVGREIVLAKIMAKLRARSPQHARKLQEMLRVKGLKRTADEMESGGFRAVPGMDATKQAEVTLDINKGDVLLGGKYKNSPITVEEIGTDELGQPTVNGRKLLAYRIKKKMPEKTAGTEKTLNNIAYSTVLAPILGAAALHMTARPLVANMMRSSDNVTPRDIEVMHRTTNRSRVAAGEKPIKFHRGFENSPLAGVEGMGAELLKRKMDGNAAYVPETTMSGKKIPAHVLVGDVMSRSRIVGSLLGYEFGHAQPGMVGGAKGQMLARVLAMGLLAPAAGSAGYSKGRGDKTNTLQKTLLGLGVAGTGGVLAEEARASLKARAMLKRLGKSPAGLRRAYLSYLLGSISAGGAAASGGMLFGKWDASSSKKRKKHAMEKVAKFMISKGPNTAAEYLEGLRKLMAAKALEKAPAEVAATAKKPKKPSALAKLIKKKKKQKPLYGQPTGHGTAAFRFGD